jgi:hypothetical protein
MESVNVTFEDVGKPPVRVTVSIPVDLYEFLSGWAFAHRVSFATACREAFQRMNDAETSGEN